jgi:hypothetical protein
MQRFLVGSQDTSHLHDHPSSGIFKASLRRLLERLRDEAPAAYKDIKAVLRASVDEVAMFLAISNFTTVNRAALFAARVAVRAASSNGGIWA